MSNLISEHSARFTFSTDPMYVPRFNVTGISRGLSIRTDEQPFLSIVITWSLPKIGVSVQSTAQIAFYIILRKGKRLSMQSNFHRGIRGYLGFSGYYGCCSTPAFNKLYLIFQEIIIEIVLFAKVYAEKHW